MNTLLGKPLCDLQPFPPHPMAQINSIGVLELGPSVHLHNRIEALYQVNFFGSGNEKGAPTTRA